MPGGSSGDVSLVQPHLLLRFAVATFVWAVVIGGQALVLKLLYIPYVEDKVGQLVDLLSVANVSVLMLPEPLCGYYLHGRSVHAHADASMLELNKQLRAEEDGLTSQRGLSPASEVQTFQVHLTPRLRELYDHKFLHASMADTAANANTADAAVRRRTASGNNQMNVPLTGISIERARRAGDGFRSNPEGAVARYVEMNALLRDFIDGSLAGHEYSIREKTYLEKLLRLPPDMSFARDSVFLYDSSGNWTRSMLYGREYDLVILEVSSACCACWLSLPAAARMQGAHFSASLRMRGLFLSLHAGARVHGHGHVAALFFPLGRDHLPRLAGGRAAARLPWPEQPGQEDAHRRPLPHLRRQYARSRWDSAGRLSECLTVLTHDCLEPSLAQLRESSIGWQRRQFDSVSGEACGRRPAAATPGEWATLQLSSGVGPRSRASPLAPSLTHSGVTQSSVAGAAGRHR